MPLLVFFLDMVLPKSLTALAGLTKFVFLKWVFISFFSISLFLIFSLNLTFLYMSFIYLFYILLPNLSFSLFQLGKRPPIVTLADFPGYGHAITSAMNKRMWNNMMKDYLKNRPILTK